MSGPFHGASASLPARPSAGTRWLAGFCAVLVWVLGLFAASPELHAALHADADQADHDCVITWFSHGPDTGLADPIAVARPLVRPLDRAPVAEVVLAGSITDRLQPSQGPPVR